MSTILAIETSTELASAALLHRGELLRASLQAPRPTPTPFSP
jgi:tRNA A37 threonylcarbamoyladenosine modification protein TsaB